jgi:alkylglycerol monooxygenase
MINFIALAIPLFFVLIGVELLVARAQRKSVYRFDDAIVDLSCGIGQQVTGPFYLAILAIPYAWVYEHGRLVTFAEGSPWPWVIGFFGVDLAYYWWHRWTHEMNLGWTTHVVHHQSEEYNLAVALRQSLSSAWSGWPFYLPLAVLGVPPLVFVTHSALNTLYQFWIHTETIRKLGPIEWVMNTPSHHRVHHAINPRYLDKNYAGVLIIWDRMFGSFIEETEEAVYGTVKPLASFDPLWANVHWAWVLAQDTVASRSLRVWFARPGWRPPGLEHLQPEPRAQAPSGPPAREITRDQQIKYQPRGVPGVAPYVALQFLPVAVATTWIVWVEQTAPLGSLVGPSAWVLLTTFVWGGLFESRRWALPLELARLAAGAALAQAYGAPLAWAWAFAGLSAAWVVALGAGRGRALSPASPPPAR